MERETVAVLDGRRNGKTARGYYADGVWVDEGEFAAQAEEIRRHRLERKRERQSLELYRRRYEFPTGAPSGGHGPVACPHMRAVHYDEPHPRYGDRFPVTRTVLRPVKGKHDCVPGVQR